MLKRWHGLRAYGVILGGQFFSIMGSQMTAFALALWAWEVTGRATALALAVSLYMIPARLIGPIMGTLIDRWDRRRTLIVSDVVSAGATLVVLLLYLSGSLEVWHLFVRAIVAGLAGNFQDRALNATIPLLVPRKHFGRVAGLMRLTNSGSGLIAPVLAAALYGFIGLTGIVLIDASTFAIAVGSLVLVRIPSPPRVIASVKQGWRRFYEEAREGFRYVLSTPSFLTTCLLVGWDNVFKVGVMWPLLQPLILARSGGDSLVLGQVNSSLSAGVLLGALALVVWGGMKHRFRGFLGFGFASALALILFAVARRPAIWILGMLLYGVTHSMAGMHVQALIVAKAPPQLLGRVQGCRDVISRLPGSLAQLAMGPLADLVFEPAMTSDSGMAGVFGAVVGRGPGAGMALMVLLGAFLTATATGAGFLIPRARDADRILPDHA